MAGAGGEEGRARGVNQAFLPRRRGRGTIRRMVEGATRTPALESAPSTACGPPPPFAALRGRRWPTKKAAGVSPDGQHVRPARSPRGRRRVARTSRAECLLRPRRGTRLADRGDQPDLIPRARTGSLRGPVRGAPFSHREKGSVVLAFLGLGGAQHLLGDLARMGADGLFDGGGDVGVLLQELAHVLAALADALAVIAEP